MDGLTWALALPIGGVLAPLAARRALSRLDVLPLGARRLAAAFAGVLAAKLAMLAVALALVAVWRVDAIPLISLASGIAALASLAAAFLPAAPRARP